MKFPETLYAKHEPIGSDDPQETCILTDEDRDALIGDLDTQVEVAEYRLVRTVRLRRRVQIVEMALAKPAPTKAPKGRKGGR